MGIGETHGGSDVTKALDRAVSWSSARTHLVTEVCPSHSKRRTWRRMRQSRWPVSTRVPRATGRRFCELVGGPVRDSVEFAAYLFFRYCRRSSGHLERPAAGRFPWRGDRALDSWGEVRTPEAMAAMAAQFRDKWGFRVFKLKGGVLDPEARVPDDEGPGGAARPEGVLRIDPNGRWKQDTAVRIGKKLAEMRSNTTKIRSTARRRWPRFESRRA